MISTSPDARIAWPPTAPVTRNGSWAESGAARRSATAPATACPAMPARPARIAPLTEPPPGRRAGAARHRNEEGAVRAQRRPERRSFPAVPQGNRPAAFPKRRRAGTRDGLPRARSARRPRSAPGEGDGLGRRGLGPARREEAPPAAVDVDRPGDALLRDEEDRASRSRGLARRAGPRSRPPRPRRRPRRGRSASPTRTTTPPPNVPAMPPRAPGRTGAANDPYARRRAGSRPASPPCGAPSPSRSGKASASSSDGGAFPCAETSIREPASRTSIAFRVDPDRVRGGAPGSKAGASTRRAGGAPRREALPRPPRRLRRRAVSRAARLPVTTSAVGPATRSPSRTTRTPGPPRSPRSGPSPARPARSPSPREDRESRNPSAGARSPPASGERGTAPWRRRRGRARSSRSRPRPRRRPTARTSSAVAPPPARGPASRRRREAARPSPRTAAAPVEEPPGGVTVTVTDVARAPARDVLRHRRDRGTLVGAATCGAKKETRQGEESAGLRDPRERRLDRPEPDVVRRRHVDRHRRARGERLGRSRGHDRDRRRQRCRPSWRAARSKSARPSTSAATASLPSASTRTERTDEVRATGRDDDGEHLDLRQRGGALRAGERREARGRPCPDLQPQGDRARATLPE